MAIEHSNSCSTLVSLDDVQKIGQEQDCYQKAPSYVRTNIVLPNDDCFDEDEADSYDISTQCEQHLYLPSIDEEAVDICLRSIPQIMESADELLANPPRHFTTSSRERLLYVGQGEVAYVTPQHCDVIASDKATTCHILALRSTSERGPMVSLTHIDGVGFESCIRNMIQEHKLFHADGEEKKQEYDMDDRINIDVHIMGGFEDDDESSRSISNFLMHLLARIALEESHEITVTLKTCAISSINDNGHGCPIGRGLGVSIKTGEAFLAKVDNAVAGPSPNLRSARLWSGNGGKKLSTIHSHSSDKMFVQPFRFAHLKQMESLVTLPDSLLLEYTSTSPDVEEGDFCDSVRSTLSFMRKVKCESVFGSECRRPAIFVRVGTTNQWKLTTQF